MELNIINWCAMKIKIILIIFTCSILLFSCEKESEDPPSQTEIAKAKSNILNSEIDFSLKLFEQVLLDHGDKNLAVSPYSAYIALSMAANGAEGETLEEMLAALGIEGNRVSVLNEAIQSINESLLYSDPETRFESANSLWYNESISIHDKYRQTVMNYYEAESRGLDFSDPNSKDVINGWVNDKTNGKIPELLSSVSASDLCFIINALYFNGIWTDTFDPELTKFRGFYISSDEDVMVPMMENHGTYNVYNHNGVSGIELPYGNGNWSMLIFTPPYKDMENTIGFFRDEVMDNLDQLLDGFEEKSLRIRLPQFKIESNFKMKEYLKAMGIEMAFSSQADFSRLTKAVCWIDQVIQKTYLRVNEDGTEAAAATAVVMVGAPPSISFSRPFIYFIREKTTGSILFIGQVVNPNA